MTVRPALPDDHLTVMRILDAAMLETDASEVRGRIDAGDVLVAEDGGRILGAAVMESRDSGGYIDSIAVRRARRGQGIGTALVEAARERHGTLTAEFDPSVRAFYESLEFDIESTEERRLWGLLESED
ncbi:GNAT family N-acetyltransferase [Haladaptatus halobius]|jgi:GNAT superfamily N-acetyltransferase|uniref:GNAT family N-acetyltransferase n=1 Tax=Haladaptatus halobius TaxID=2884875 RepID=UPI001D0A4969|nr:GNAT family N-acetyltransferase [Haladaptatus halobius]